MEDATFPGSRWEALPAVDAGFDARRLEKAKSWIDDGARPGGYRVVLVRRGRVVAEWYREIAKEAKLGIASAAKSIYSNVLGIVAEEGGLPSVDSAVFDIYPEMMDVAEGEGPKPGRYAFEKDRAITFRRLISNTSGYMKPGEEPGRVFNYQTFGMNILTHALAVIYGRYDTDEPRKLPGFGGLIREKVARPLGADWDYTLTNFDLHERAKIGVFGYYCQVHSNPLDLARVGLLWCRRGNWDGRQVIPERWMRESVRTNPDLIANCPEDEWKYGYGFWTNDHGKLWKNLPRSGFTASGAGGHYVSVFPDHDIVVVQNPGCYKKNGEGNPERGNEAFLELVLDAIH